MRCPHWLLALTIPFSRSDRAHTCPQALVPGGPKDCSGQIALLASFLRLPTDLARSPGGTNTLAGTDPTVNAPSATLGRRTEARDRGPGRRPGAIVPGAPPALVDGIHGRGAGALVGLAPLSTRGRTAGSRAPQRAEPRCGEEGRGTNRWHAGEPSGPPHATWCSKPNGLSVPAALYFVLLTQCVVNDLVPREERGRSRDGRCCDRPRWCASRSGLGIHGAIG
jgi:hypothetical protein